MAEPRPVLIFWQELLPGDLRKIEARSAEAATGGGARDLRFPDASFRPVLERMFPEAGGVQGRPVRRGTLVWDAEDGRHQQVVEYWPPTDARPGEGRLARINEIEPIRNPPDTHGGPLILLLVLDDINDLRAFYTTSAELQAEWHDDVARPILECLGDDQRNGVAARGWLNLVNGQRYCHGG